MLILLLMKHADIILKVYSAALATLLTALVAMAVFHVRISSGLILGIATTACSLHMYYRPNFYHHSDMQFS